MLWDCAVLLAFWSTGLWFWGFFLLACFRMANVICWFVVKSFIEEDFLFRTCIIYCVCLNKMFLSLDTMGRNIINYVKKAVCLSSNWRIWMVLNKDVCNLLLKSWHSLVNICCFWYSSELWVNLGEGLLDCQVIIWIISYWSSVVFLYQIGRKRKFAYEMWMTSFALPFGPVVDKFLFLLS